MKRVAILTAVVAMAGAVPAMAAPRLSFGQARQAIHAQALKGTVRIGRCYRQSATAVVCRVVVSVADGNLVGTDTAYLRPTGIVVQFS